MTILEQLSEPQQYAVLRTRAGWFPKGDQYYLDIDGWKPTPSTETLATLQRMGLICMSEWYGYSVTQTGLMVLFAHQQRQNTTQLFRKGDRVLTMDFTWRSGELCFQGRDVVVTKVSDHDVAVQRNDFRAVRLPESLAHYEHVQSARLLDFALADQLEAIT